MDRIVTIAAAIASPVLGLLVDQHVITALTATDVGSILAAAVASYHGGIAVANRRAASVQQPASSVQ